MREGAPGSAYGGKKRKKKKRWKVKRMNRKRKRGERREKCLKYQVSRTMRTIKSFLGDDGDGTYLCMCQAIRSVNNCLMFRIRETMLKGVD